MCLTTTLYVDSMKDIASRDAQRRKESTVATSEEQMHAALSSVGDRAQNRSASCVHNVGFTHACDVPHAFLRYAEIDQRFVFPTTANLPQKTMLLRSKILKRHLMVLYEGKITKAVQTADSGSNWLMAVIISPASAESSSATSAASGPGS